MSFRDLAIGAYAELLDAIGSGKVQPLVQPLGYEYHSGESDFLYTYQERDFTRELVNAFNRYVHWLNRIALWERILITYPENDALELRFEFTALPLDYCLHFPYAFKARLAFCATKLCYANGVPLSLITKKEVQPDHKICVESLGSTVRHWNSGSRLVQALELVDGKVYQDITLKFRRKAQHRLPPCLDFGYTANVSLVQSTESTITLSFGEVAPLYTSNLLPILASEAEHMRRGFFAYRVLVDEHCGNANENLTTG